MTPSDWWDILKIVGSFVGGFLLGGAVTTAMFQKDVKELTRAGGGESKGFD